MYRNVYVESSSDRMITFANALSQQLVSVSAFTAPSPVGTVTFWLRPNSVNAPYWQEVMNAGQEFRIAYSGATMEFSLLNKMNKSLQTATVFVNNTLYHMAATWNAGAINTTTTLYINAIQNSTITDQVGSQVASTLYLGSNGGGNYLSGQIGDFRVYNRNLTLPEIETIYACNGIDGIYDGMINRWFLGARGEGVAVSGIGNIKDYSDTANHLTPNGNPVGYGDFLSMRRKING